MNEFQKEISIAIKNENPVELMSLAIARTYFLQDKTAGDIVQELAEISKIEFSKEISSAAIGFKNAQLYLWFNPDFFMNYVETSDCLLFIILHELLHKLKGDIFKQFSHTDTPENKILANIAFDLVINKELYYEFFNRSVPLLKRLYASSKEILLRILTPPEYFSSIPFEKFDNMTVKEKLDNIRNQLIEPIKENSFIIDKVVELYSAVWFCNSSVTTIYDLLLDIKNLLYGKDKIKYIFVKLIGNHSENQQENEWEKWLKKILKKKFSPYGGAGSKTEELSVIPKLKRSNIFYNAVLKAITPACTHSVLKEKLLPEYGFIPFPGRKETFLLACGWYPLFYPNPVLKKDFDEWKTHIYIDVSGSTFKYWGILYGLILSIKDIISTPIYAFSDDVFELDINDLKNGKVRTSYGTSFDCIVEHATRNGFKRLLIVTDGNFYFRDSSKVKEKAKKELDIFAIITLPSDFFVSPEFEEIIGENKKNIKWWCLPDILEKDEPLIDPFEEKRIVAP